MDERIHSMIHTVIEDLLGKLASEINKATLEDLEPLAKIVVMLMEFSYFITEKTQKGDTEERFLKEIMRSMKRQNPPSRGDWTIGS